MKWVKNTEILSAMSNFFEPSVSNKDTTHVPVECFVLCFMFGSVSIKCCREN